MQFFNNCVGWDKDDVDCEGGLRDMIDNSVDVTRQTFMRHVDREELKEIERYMGYCEHPRQGLTMAGDWHISYSRSKLHGKTVYFFTHSAIEYVFK